jgi:M3 family oligoendopeptidase
MLTQKFSEIAYVSPDFDAYEKEYTIAIQALKDAVTLESQEIAIKHISALAREIETMSSLVYVRHSIDTTDVFYEKEQEKLDHLAPKIQQLTTEYHKVLSASPFKEALSKIYGEQLFVYATLSTKTINETVIADLQEENKLVSEYDKLIASASIYFEGEERNLSGLTPFAQSKDRDLRKRATDARWNWFAENMEKLDDIYDKLVTLRHQIALKLGYKNFTELGYARMRRSDYSAKEISAFRDNMFKYIVPIVNELKERQRQRLGYAKLEYYDQAFMYQSGNPTPKGDPDWILNHGKTMYNELSPETKTFFDFMTSHELLDLVNKKGKMGGGYCTYLPSYQAPFIFSNFNGTSHDIDVLTHEAGHAFQVYNSRHFEVNEYYWPTSESAEIHSMSMEFFTWKWMSLFFEEDAEKYKFEHLAGSMNFIPYGTVVDEFQHRVYAEPTLTPAERRAVWREIEKKYLPYRDYTGIPYLENGGFWHGQAHIFASPFYYIDYVLAQLCAFQFWIRMQEDFEGAWRDYVNLCKAGGSKSFLSLVKLANIDSPFEEETIISTAAKIKKWLDAIDDKKF